MKYRSTRQVVEDLQRHGRLIVVQEEVDPYLELAEIHRRVYRNQGPALLFANVRNCQFPVVSNLFGTMDRARFLFRDTLAMVRTAIRWKIDMGQIWKQPWKLWRAPQLALSMRPRSTRSAAVLCNTCRLSQLPQMVCWPDDGGPFVTLPQVLSQRPGSERHCNINLGMYRVQLAGNEYISNEECGLHYQIHRGIGIHHAQAVEAQVPLPVSITTGGSPAMTLGAVMPLPEGMSELMFAGALAGHRIPLHAGDGFAPIYADADFCVTGQIDPTALKPEGPFGDHLGYYTKVHDFPYVKLHRVYHRDGAIWPATVVGRPPQEDTIFGQLIHELTEPVIPSVLPGVKDVHAVDAAGVHPLLLAVGSERYTPYRKPDRPQELLTQASAILGQGQLSLAKYLWIIDGSDGTAPPASAIESFLEFALRRVDWQRDLHFQTRTTIDTLDYSGEGLNRGSKLVIAAAGRAIRELPVGIPPDLKLPSSWSNPQFAMKGVLVVQDQPYHGSNSKRSMEQACDAIATGGALDSIPLVVVVDDSQFSGRNINNFLWSTFTRSNPASDVYGIGAFVEDKHFGCRGSLVIDARRKPHHAPPLVEDPEIIRRVDSRAAHGGALAQYL